MGARVEHFGESSFQLSVLTHLLVASFAGCFGYMIGGILAVAKVSDLYARLETAEKGLAAHTTIVSELTNALKLLLSDVENVRMHSPSIEQARLVLSQI